MKAKPTSLAALAVVACLSLGAAGTAPAALKKKAPPPIDVQKNLADLYAAAKQEGSVIWQVGAPAATYTPLVQAFQAKYPGISVQVINIQGTDVPTRMITEGSNLSFDLSLTDPANMQPAVSRKLFAAPRWTLYGVPPSKISYGGRLVRSYDFALGWFYNTQKVQTSQLPRSWTAVVNPSFKSNSVLLNAQGAEGFEGNLLNKTWNLVQYRAFLQKFKAQGWTAQAAGAAVINAVATGQALYGVSALVQLPKSIAAGAPLAIAPVGPVVARPQGPAVPKYSHHPAAAKLLGVFLVSPESVPIWKNLGFGPAEPCAASDLAQLICNAKVKVVYVDTPPKAVNYNSLQALNRAALGF